MEGQLEKEERVKVVKGGGYSVMGQTSRGLDRVRRVPLGRPSRV